MRVFVVASSPVTRDRLRQQVESDEVRIVGESASLDAADLARGVDVLLVADDLALTAWPPDVDLPARAVVVLAGFKAADAAERLSRLDLSGWAVVGPGATGDEVRAALAAADAGLAAVPVDIGFASAERHANAVAARDFSPVHEVADDLDGVLDEPLTPREREVLEELSRGRSNREIAGRLGISEHTAKFHVASVLAKLGAANRTDAVRRGLRRGLVAL